MQSPNWDDNLSISPPPKQSHPRRLKSSLRTNHQVSSGFSKTRRAYIDGKHRSLVDRELPNGDIVRKANYTIHSGHFELVSILHEDGALGQDLKGKSVKQLFALTLSNAARSVRVIEIANIMATMRGEYKAWKKAHQQRRDRRGGLETKAGLPWTLCEVAG
jgi:hypothetical protein